MGTVGIDIGGTFIKAGLVITGPPGDGKIIETRKVKTEPKRLGNTIIEIAKALGAEKLGVGAPGLIDKNGVIFRPPNLLGINKLPLKKILEDNLKIPVIVDNDANVIALGEYKYGAGRGVKNLVVMTLGTGVGGGVIINGKLHRGRDFAGEIGHITIDKNGPLCRCGNYGCLETYVGGHYIVKRVQEAIKKGIKTSLNEYKEITPEVISKEAYKGDRYAREVISEMGDAIGIGLANICVILDPERIIIGGGIANMGKLLFDKIEQSLKKRLYTREEIDIRKSELGDRAGVLGAALLFK